MDIVLALTLAAKLADLAVAALNGVSAAANTYAKVRPLIDTVIQENRNPTSAEWETLNRMFDDSFNHLMAD